MAAPAPAPRPAATLAVLAVICVAATLYGARDIVTWAKGLGGSPSSPPPARAGGRRHPAASACRSPSPASGDHPCSALRVRSRRGRPGGRRCEAARAATAAAPGRRSRPIRCGGPCCSAGRRRRRRSPARTDASSAATSSSRAHRAEPVSARSQRGGRVDGERLARRRACRQCAPDGDRHDARRGRRLRRRRARRFARPRRSAAAAVRARCALPGRRRGVRRRRIGQRCTPRSPSATKRTTLMWAAGPDGPWSARAGAWARARARGRRRARLGGRRHARTGQPAGRGSGRGGRRSR